MSDWDDWEDFNSAMGAEAEEAARQDYEHEMAIADYFDELEANE